MNDKQITQCINAAEMGLTQEQASELLEIPLGLVHGLTKEFNIQFSCLRSKTNAKRRSDNRNSNRKRRPIIEHYDRRSKTQHEAELATKVRRNSSLVQNDPSQHKKDLEEFKSLIASLNTTEEKIKLCEEITYAYRIRNLREQEHKTPKGPKLPYNKKHTGPICSGLY